MSKPIPIHLPPSRELRTHPHESEPVHSYDEPTSPLLDEEVDFHQRLQKTRRENSNQGSSGSSFWRTSPDDRPSFSSVSMKKSTETVILGSASNGSAHHHASSGGNKERKSSGGLLGNTLQTSVMKVPEYDRNISWNSDGTPPYRRRGESERATNQSNGKRDAKGNKDARKQRDANLRAERHLKREAQNNEVDAGHVVLGSISTSTSVGSVNSTLSMGSADNGGMNGMMSLHSHDPTSILPPQNGFSDMNHMSSPLDRSSSDQSTGSILYGKTPHSDTILGKSTSLIFPTGVQSAGPDQEMDQAKKRKINLLLDQCETVRFPFKKKLVLSNMGLVASDIPLAFLCGTPLGNTLHKLSLSGNSLGSIPIELVQSLPTLKHLDLSQCRLHQLPHQWNLPQLRHLNLSTNSLRDFPEEGMLEGLPELQELNMFGNKVTAIVVPHNASVLSKLETLDLGYNDIAYLPDELDRITSLRVFKVRNNFLTKIPMRVCDMDLKSIDVASNPVNQPPLETCERGISAMKRYYQCLRMEEQSRDDQRRMRQGKKHGLRRKNGGGYGGFMKSLSIVKTPTSTGRKSTEESRDSSSNTLPGPPKSIVDAGVRVIEPKKPIQEKIPIEVMVKPVLHQESSDEVADTAIQEGEDELPDDPVKETVTINETLKVIFVGMAMVGKTSMIKRLIEGRDAIVPTHDERTVGVDIYAWDPKKDKRFEHIDSRIEIQDKWLADTVGDTDVQFSVWDFAGQHVYHATHELFFSSGALYILVWDMGATNRDTKRRKFSTTDEAGGDFKLSYDSDGEDDDDDNAAEAEARRADRALERDIDEKVQFWVDCIQSSAPGSAILPVASFADYFANDGGEAEARRRCNMLKERLLRHEERRIQGIEQRLQEYKDQNRADDPAAHRLRDLLSSTCRPKLIFGEGKEDSVVRVSGTQYIGFDKLTEKIISIATGRWRGSSKYPIFGGQVGTRIPRMRLQVREEVRTMRDRFKVVEWGYFINQMRDIGLTNVEDISDALHFLTNIGELSYFGGNVSHDRTMTSSAPPAERETGSSSRQISEAEQSAASPSKVDEEDDLDDDRAILSMDETSITAPGTEDGSLTTVDDFMNSGLSQFVFLNPRWLVAAVACILRHDLDREIKETRRLIAAGQTRSAERSSSFYDAQLNCPIITAEDALMLWQAKRITKKAAERAQEYSNNMTVTPFEFLQLLLIRFGVFVPIDLSIQKAFLGGKEYARAESLDTDIMQQPMTEVSVEPSADDLALRAKFFFLPSLLGPGEPAEAWTYKNTDSWKTTLCHSVLFPDGVPPGLMERLTASVLSSVYAVSNRSNNDPSSQKLFGKDFATCEGRLTIREVLCWRTAFFLKLGTVYGGEDGSERESVVEIFGHLADRDSHLCVGSDYMGVGMRRLIISGRGQIGDGGRKIWKGGYLLVCKCVTRVMDGYGGLEYERQGFCPECLAKKSVSEASCWEFTTIRSAAKNSEGTLRCHHHGHQVDTRLVAGPLDSLQRPEPLSSAVQGDSSVPVQDLLGGVVLVGLWDGRSRKIVRVGSGFIVDRKRGLIVTAAHTLMNIWGDAKYPFGENYYGLRQGKVVIGVIPDSEEARQKGVAMFRYFAKVVAKDPSFERDECHIDACVLRITTRMENDVGGDGEECADQPEILLLNNESAFKAEKLQALKVCEKCELEEQVRILGFNQGGEGLLGPGESLSRYVDFARGYVCKKFVSGEPSAGPVSGGRLRDRFKPREEIAVICPTIGGHSGGPCVNQQGEVIGILSRADPAENTRCYLSPASTWKPLIKMAKKSDNLFM